MKNAPPILSPNKLHLQTSSTNGAKKWIIDLDVDVQLTNILKISEEGAYSCLKCEGRLVEGNGKWFKLIKTNNGEVAGKRWRSDLLYKK